MGASQSSDQETGGSGKEVKTSYYALLGIPRNATDEEIKKAYRRKALELHPDRNYGKEELATKTFAEVQAAHEVLSDPQERAWYDSHESAILRGDDAVDGDAPTYENVRVTTADDLARMVRKFNNNVEFSDAPSGFFGFLRETFEKLAREEEIAANWEDVDTREYPSFGHKDDGYNDVVKGFYAVWTSFSTVKTFSWKDKYRLSEAPDRWYRRRMEQENNRLRQEAKREFNDAVRSLVAFVRKRDPRYIPTTQSEAERQKTLREAAAAQAARARAENEARTRASEVPEWAQMREPDDFEESEEEQVEEEVLECVACDKIFKSEKQWEAHEKSKKHQKVLRSLQHKMRKENANLDLEMSATEDGASTPDVGGDEKLESLEDEAVEHDKLDSQMNDHTVDGHPGSIKQEHLEETISNDRSPPPEINNEPAAEEDQRADDNDGEVSSSGDEDYASLETVQARLQSTAIDTPPTGESDTEGQSSSKPKMGKAAQKRAKKAAAAASGSSQQSDVTHKCEACNEVFPSKSKLFQHITKEGHAALKSVPAGSSKGKKAKGKR